MKICLICSSGGHLFLLQLLKGFWEKYERFWVTFNKEDAVSLLQDEKIYWSYFPTNRNIKNLIKNTLLAFRILKKERPDIILSSGAAIAIPFFWLSKIFKVKTVYIEAIERVENPSLSGRIVYPVSDVFIIPWPELKKFYKRGLFIGNIL